MKHLVMIAATIIVTGCEASYSDASGSYSVLPDELTDCKVYRINGGVNLRQITVMRCPNSTTSTSYSTGKTNQTTVVVDGVEYVKKD